MRIAIVNSLDERYGSTYRIRAFRDALLRHHDVFYMESSGSAFFKLLRALKTACFETYDVFLTQKFNPITIPCLLIARFRGKPTIVDWDDLDAGLQSNVVKKVFARICERFGPYLACHITTHNETVYAHAQAFAPVIKVIQGVNFQLFCPTATLRERARKKWGYLPDTFVIGHLCTFTSGGTLDIEIILRAWQTIQDPRISFILIGGGPLDEEIRRKIYRFGVESRVKLTGLLPHEDIPEVLASLDMGVVYMSDNPSNQARVSFKVIEYLTMNVPVVGKVVGETRAMLGEHIAMVADEGDFSKTMERMAKEKMHKKTREHMQRFSWETTTLPLVNLFHQLKESTCH